MTTSRQKKGAGASNSPLSAVSPGTSKISKRGSKSKSRPAKPLRDSLRGIDGLSEEEKMAEMKEIATWLSSAPLDGASSSITVTQLRTLGALLKTASQKSKELRRMTDTLVVPALLRGSGSGGGAGSKPVLLTSSNKDVRLYAAVCCFRVLKLHAPDSPFSDEILGLLLGELFRTSVVKSLLLMPAGPRWEGEDVGGGVLKSPSKKPSVRGRDKRTKRSKGTDGGDGTSEEEREVKFLTALDLCEMVASVKMYLLMLDLEGADGMLVDLCGTVFDVLDELDGLYGENGVDALGALETLDGSGMASMLEEDVAYEGVSRGGPAGPAGSVVGSKSYIPRIQKALLSIVSNLINDADFISQQLLDVVLGHLAPSAMFGANSSASAGGQQATQERLSSSFAKSLIRESREALQPSVQKFITQVMDGQTPVESDLVGNPSQLLLKVHEASPQIMLPVMPNIVPSLEDGRLGDARRAEILDLLCSMFCESGKGGKSNIISAEYPELLDGVLQRMKDQSAQVRKVAFKHVHAIVNSMPTASEKKRVVQAVGELLCHVDERSRSMAVSQFSDIVAESPHLVETDMFGKLGQRLWDSKMGVRKAAAAGIAKIIRTWCARGANVGFGIDTAATAQGAHSTASSAVGITASVTSFPFKAQLVTFIESLCVRALDPTDGELQAYIEVDVLLKNGLFAAKKMSVSSMRDWWSMIWSAAGDKTKKVLLDMMRRSCQVKERISTMLQLRVESKVERTTRVSVHGLHEAAGASQEDRNQPSTSSASDRLVAMVKSTALHYLKHVPKAEESLERIFAMKDNNVFRNLETMASFGIGFAASVAASKELQARIGTKGPTSECASSLAALMCPTLVTPEVLAAALRSASGSSRDYGLVVELTKAEPRLFVGAFDALDTLVQSDDSLEATLAAEVLASAGKYIFANEKSKMLDDESLEKLVDLCACGQPKTAKVATMALLRAIKFRDDRDEIVDKVCDGAWAALRDVDIVDDHPLLLSHVKVLSVILRMVTAKLDLYAPKLHRLVMDNFMNQDLSLGKALTDRDDDERGIYWGRPSADVEIKSELLKALSQAIVPIDCVGTPSAMVVDVAKQLCAQLQDLTEIDTSGPQFESLVWKLKRVTWIDENEKKKANKKGKSDGKIVKSGKRKAGKDADGGIDPDPELLLDSHVVELDAKSYPTDEMKLLYEKNVADASPDAGWIRLAAAKSLFRLFRIYDRNFTGNDYLGLGLACQDPIDEVRRAILKKIDSNMSYLLRHQRSAQKRMAKTLALYSLYAADPTELNVKHAFHSMQRVIEKRRTAVAQMSLAKAALAPSDAGTLSNEMPEFALVYLVYFIAHHPDYSAYDMAAANNAVSSDSLVVLFKDTMQMFLEALMLPLKRPKNAEAMTNILKVNVGVAMKILRQLKYCDIFDVENEAVDATATVNGHQICDIGLSLSRRLLHALSPIKGAMPSKFSGSLHLPSSYFHQKSLTAEDKRLDGSDLPPELRGPQLRDLFSEQCGIRMKYRTNANKRKAANIEPSVMGGGGDTKKKLHMHMQQE